MRLTGTDIDVYRYLEPLYNDYRKLRRKMPDGSKYYDCERFMLELWLPEVYVPFPFVALLMFFVLSFDMLEYSLTHVDEVIDELLTKDYSCDIALPRIKKRYVKHFTAHCTWFSIFFFCFCLYVYNHSFYTYVHIDKQALCYLYMHNFLSVVT